MRSFTSAVAVILGLLLTAVAMPSLWLDRNIVREDGFVELAAPLGMDPGFQEQLTEATVATLDFGPFVASSVQQVISELLGAGVQSLSGLPGYRPAWEETLRSSHRLNFASEGSAGSDQGPATSLTLDVAPLVGLVTHAIGNSLGQPLEAPEQILLNVGEAEHRQLLERLATLTPLAYPLIAGAAAAFLLGLLAARRRWTVLLGTGVGLLILAAVWTLAAGVAEGLALGQTSGNEVAELFKTEFVAAATASFGDWVRWVVTGAAVLLASSFLGRSMSGRRRRPSAGHRDRQTG